MGSAGSARDLLSAPAPLPGRIVGAWDLSRESGTDRIVDTGPNKCHGTTVNLPTRAVTGPFWNANEHGTDRLTPQHDAMHFHTDDVGDLGWEPTLQITPAGGPEERRLCRPHFGR